MKVYHIRTHYMCFEFSLFGVSFYFPKSKIAVRIRFMFSYAFGLWFTNSFVSCLFLMSYCKQNTY